MSSDTPSLGELHSDYYSKLDEYTTANGYQGYVKTAGNDDDENEQDDGSFADFTEAQIANLRFVLVNENRQAELDKASSKF